IHKKAPAKPARHAITMILSVFIHLPDYGCISRPKSLTWRRALPFQPPKILSLCAPQNFIPCKSMGIRSILAKPFAAFIAAETKKWSQNPHHYQEKIRQHLVREAAATLFGRDHGFREIRHYEDF